MVQSEVKARNAEHRYGYVLAQKDSNTFRLLYENWNSLGVFAGDDKTTNLNKLVKQYQVDTIAGCEAQCDWGQAPVNWQFGELIARWKDKRLVAGRNITILVTNAVRDQRGGASMMTIGQITKHVVDSGVDPTGLGRWT